MIGIGIIGCGYWGPNLARNFASLEGCELRALCDEDPARLAQAKRRHPSAMALSDATGLIEDARIDAVAICTPMRTHFELARAALRAGKHVLVEKPLAHTVDAARELVELAEARERVLLVDHTFVYGAPVRAIRAAIVAGELGDLLYIDSVRINLGLFRPDANVVWDLAAHDVSIVDHLIDADPLWVCGQGVAHYGDVENVAYLTLMYPGNLITHINVNWLAPVKIRSTVIGGSKRMIVYDDLDPSEKIRIYDRGVDVSGANGSRERALVDYRLGTMTAPYIDRTESLASVCADFVEAIASARPPLVDGRAGLRVVKILAAAEASLRRGGEKIEIGGA